MKRTILIAVLSIIITSCSDYHEYWDRVIMYDVRVEYQDSKIDTIKHIIAFGDDKPYLDSYGALMTRRHRPYAAGVRKIKILKRY